MELLIRRQSLSLLPTADRARTLLTPPLTILLQREGRSTETEISLLLCDDETIRELNRTYREQDKPTDVLSFAQEDDPALLGDIVISIPTAERQARAAGWDLDSEIILLAVHGLLHLLGEDDETVSGARQMQEKTVQVLNEAHIPLPPEGNHPFFREVDP